MAPDGTVIAGSRPDSSSPTATRKLRKATVRSLLRREGQAIEYVDYTGETVAGTLKTVPRMSLAVVAEIPLVEGYAQVNRLRNVTMMIVLGVLLVVGLIGYVLGLVIVRPLDRLTKGAAEVAGGDLAVDLPVLGGGEVAYLTQVFNNMVARLREGRQELERLSVTDGLTGLFNRRHLIDALTDEVRRARRLKHPLALLMADVDRFKDFNDTFGHQAGDQVLTKVADVLRDSVREIDCAARYGGEEFVVLLPETGAAGAADVAERIRSRLAQESFSGGAITLSIGVAEFPEHGENPETLIAGADAALYRAKREGRDRVILANGVPAGVEPKEE